MKPLVSILIPAFNVQDWIEETVASAIAQTWPRTEIIIVDDGSTDRTLEIAQRYASKNVRVVAQPRQSAAAARNTAYALSQGDFIQWLDADDLLAPDKIERQLSARHDLPTDRVLLSSAWGRFIHRPARARFAPTLLWNDLAPLEWMLRKMEHNIYMQTATWLAPRRLVDAAGPWDTRLLSDDDGEFFCRVMLQSDHIAFVPESKVYYRTPAPSRSLSYVGLSNSRLDAQFLSMDLQVGHVRSIEDSERARAACLTYLQASLHHFYPQRRDLVERAERLSHSLGGGGLSAPALSWKYTWIAALFGRHLAKYAQLLFPRVRWSLVRGWDWLAAGFDRRSRA